MRDTLSRRVATATLFGVLVFISKLILPTPFDKMVIAPQALLLALGFLSIGRLGGTSVAAVGGLLSAIWRAPYAPFTMAFALIYGLLVDGLCYAMKVTDTAGDLRKIRLVAAVTLSTAIVGLSSYYVTTLLLGLIPRNLLLELAMFTVGILNGLVAAHLALLVWPRIRKFLVQTSLA